MDTKRKRVEQVEQPNAKTETDEYVLIHVNYDCGDAVYIVPLSLLKSYCEGVIDVMQVMLKQNGWHCENVDMSNDRERLDFDYMGFLLGIYMPYSNSNIHEFYKHLGVTIDLSLEGVLKKHEVNNASRLELPRHTTYFFARNDCCV